MISLIFTCLTHVYLCTHASRQREKDTRKETKKETLKETGEREVERIGGHRKDERKNLVEKRDPVCVNTSS